LDLEVKQLRDFLFQENDPVRQAVVALALEEYSTSEQRSSKNSTRELLSLALELQQKAKKQFDESSVLKKTRYSEIEMNRQAIMRLIDPEYYFAQSRELLGEFRLSEARKLLDAGIRRHPDSVKLRDAFIQTLIDEADLRPELFQELIATAIQQLEMLTSNTAQTAFSSLLKLAELYERTAHPERAILIYRQIADQSQDERQRLLARSRSIALRVRTSTPPNQKTADKEPNL
jgi:hypothetical protein